MIFQNSFTNFPWTLDQFQLAVQIFGLVVIVLILLYIGFSSRESTE
jgi:hypothetical protein